MASTVPEHKPERGSNVEAWLKRKRDEYLDCEYDAWYACAGALLDDYRLHADTGVPLNKDASEG